MEDFHHAQVSKEQDDPCYNFRMQKTSSLPCIRRLMGLGHFSHAPVSSLYVRCPAKALSVWLDII